MKVGEVGEEEEKKVLLALRGDDSYVESQACVSRFPLRGAAPFAGLAGRGVLRRRVIFDPLLMLCNSDFHDWLCSMRRCQIQGFANACRGSCSNTGIYTDRRCLSCLVHFCCDSSTLAVPPYSASYPQ
jgi:hypothetical protein